MMNSLCPSFVVHHSAFCDSVPVVFEQRFPHGKGIRRRDVMLDVVHRNEDEAAALQGTYSRTYLT
jgi:hypothetical protein